MELWIRNQDRDILTKVESFCCVNNTIVCLPTRLDCSTDLGTYKTPERALEILDEIQKLLNTFDPANMARMIVYEMPKE